MGDVLNSFLQNRRGRRAGYGNFGDFATSTQQVFVTPEYLLRAARRKYGDSIYVIGAEESQLNDFWEKVEIKASTFSSRPEEVARSIVDITAKEHVNHGAEPDSFEIINTQSESTSQKKTYSLNFAKEWEFGGNINVGASFFNVLGGGGPSLGLGGSARRTTRRDEATGKEEERSLSQQYGLTGKMQVAPKSRVAVKITTYAVNYTVKVKAVFSIPATTFIPFYYKSGFWKLLCPGVGTTCRKFGYISAAELFQGENDFQNFGGANVTFSKETDLSYLSETIEMYKEEYPATT